MEDTAKSAALSLSSENVGTHQSQLTQSETSFSSLQEAHRVVRDLVARGIVTWEQVASSQRAVSAKKKPPKEALSKPRRPSRSRPVALLLAYDGTVHCGFTETLSSAEPDNSIERHLFDALRKCCLLMESSETDPHASGSRPAHYSRAGRTDRGVSSNGQVIALHLRSNFPPDLETLPNNSCDIVGNRKEFNYPAMLNRLLPPTIRILGWCPVTPEFSARFSAVARKYRYYFESSDLNLEQMNKALQSMVGTHDFRNLCKINAREVYNFVRVIESAKIVQCTSSVTSSSDSPPSPVVHCFHIDGRAFLWHQIRCIAAILFSVGKGLEEASLVPRLLDISVQNRKPAYEMASDAPLVLHACTYRRLHFGYTVTNLWKVDDGYSKIMHETAIALEKHRDALHTLRSEAKVRLDDLVDFHDNVLHRKPVRKKRKRKANHKPGDIKRKRDEDTKNDGDEHEEDNDTDEIDNDEKNSLNWLPLKYQSCDQKKTLLKWGEALSILRPLSDQREKARHVPILDRSLGTTYEEKVRSLLQASLDDGKTRVKYDVEQMLQEQKDNVPPDKDKDEKFYDIMLNQGGSAWD